MLKKPAKFFKNENLVKIFIVFAVLVVTLLLAYRAATQNSNISVNKIVSDKFGKLLATPTPTPSPSPTPRPLTFAEMNALYGPCVYLPTFLYHHIQSREAATADKQQSLTVYTDIFKSQMQYLKDHGYNTVTMQDLINFFDAGTPVPPHSVLLTFDDGYQDFYTDAYPILTSLGFKATMFTITGLVNNPDYLTWDEISSMNGPIVFANHTWSHKSLPSGTKEIQQNEITTADVQLSEHGLNSPKTFAFPYGDYTSFGETTLKGLGYQLAFGTVPGTAMCDKQRFHLPRVRIGDVQLSYYGF
jgi:peptidoglycan/xylan/chitin deacetylase (PgdA/CDA1 family)